MNKKPSEYNILACLDIDYSIDFNDFCDNFGYDVDSIKANNIYKLMQEQTTTLQTLFNNEEINLLSEIN